MGSRALLRLAGATVCLVVLAGCSGGSADDDPAAGSSAPATTSPSPSPSEALSESPSAAVTPVTGKTYDLGTLSITMPQGFKPLGPTTSGGLLAVTQFATRDGNGFLSIGATANLGQGDLDAAGAQALKNTDDSPVRLPDREVGGEQVFAVQGSAADTALYYSVGRVVGTKVVDLTFSFREDAEASQQLVESILGTVVWKA